MSNTLPESLWTSCGRNLSCPPNRGARTPCKGQTGARCLCTSAASSLYFRVPRALTSQLDRQLCCGNRWNLFAHVGYVSSFPVRPFRKPWPQCMARMSSVWSLQDNEKFRMSCWFSSDFSPCAAKKRSVHDAPKQQVHHGKPMFGIKEAKVQTVRRGSAHWDAGSAAAMFPTSVYRSGAKGLQNSTGLQSRGEHILPIANQSQWTV